MKIGTGASPAVVATSAESAQAGVHASRRLLELIGQLRIILQSTSLRDRQLSRMIQLRAVTIDKMEY